MSDGNTVQPHDAGVSRTLRDRVADIFRSSSQPSYSALPGEDSPRTNDQPNYGQSAEPPSQDPDIRTRLLESYHRREPVCGLESCNHGTFSPRPGTQTPAYKGIYGASGQSSARPGSAQRSEVASSMERSTELPVKNRTLMYALFRSVLTLSVES